MSDESQAAPEPADEARALVGGRLIAYGEQVVKPDSELSPQVWQSELPGYRRLLERRDRRPVQPKLHRFYRAANDALVFTACREPNDTMTCHVLVGGFPVAIPWMRRGDSYRVSKTGACTDNTHENLLAGGWLMAELPWTVPRLEAREAAPALSPVLWLEEFSDPQYAAVALRPGIWLTVNGSVVVASATSEDSWRATVVAGGHGVNEAYGSGVGSEYELSPTGAFVLRYTTDGYPLRTTQQMLVAGMSIASALDIVDKDGRCVSISG